MVRLGCFLFLALTLRFFAHEVSVFQGRMFYEEWLHRSGPGEFPDLKRLLETAFFRKTQDPVNRSLLRRLEEAGVLSSWVENPGVFSAFVRASVSRKAEERRFYYLRRALREARRSVSLPQRVAAVDHVLRSDFPALISESRFRAMLDSLERLGVLKALFKVTADLNFLSRVPGFKEKWDQELSKDSSSIAQAKVRSMMKTAQTYPEAVRVRGRRIRDSGYFDQFFKDGAQQVMSQGLFKVFQGYLSEGKLAESIQSMMQKDLMVAAMDQANLEVNRFLATGVRQLQNVSPEQLERFLKSKGYKIFQDASWIADLLHLEKEEVFKGLAETTGLWGRLLHEKYAKRFREVDDLLQARARILAHETDVARIALNRQMACFANMRLLMNARERYNLKYREEVDLQDERKTEKLYELLDTKEKPRCPESGEYHSTEYGWVFCSIHGKLPLESHE